MRTTDSIPSLELAELTNVTGGCHKKQAPPPQAPPQQMAPQDTGVDVTVATGAQAAQLIGAAQGAGGPQPPRMI